MLNLSAMEEKILPQTSYLVVGSVIRIKVATTGSLG
jgi:hypothetical protein